jgi:SAM-dependent methyltransferase
MLHHLHEKDALLAEVRRVLRPDGLLVLADIDGHAALDGHGLLRRRMAHNPLIHDNAGMVERIAAAGFMVEGPVQHPLRMGRIAIVRAHPGAR